MVKFASLCVAACVLFVLPSAAAAQNALIVHDGSAVSPGPDIRTNLQNRLTGKGYTVTQNVGVPAGSLASYGQIWDLRYSTNGAPPGNPFTADEVAAYLTYLQSGGSLFLMGENGISFGTRNAAIRDFIQTAGGGTVTLAATSGNSQTVQPPFTGPTSVASVAYLSVGGVTALPKGAFVTKDTATSGAAIVFNPGVLSNAAAGTLLAVFDVNFLMTTANDGLQALVGNIISYLAAPVPAASADLSVTKTQSSAAPAAGSNLTYTITVTNNGPSDAATVSLSDPLPANTTFVSATAPAGWTLATPAVGATGTVTATRATLANGSGAQSFTIVVLVPAGVASETSLSNTATVSTATTDPTAANNSATARATVAVLADLAVTKTQSVNQPAPLAHIVYQVIVTNNGPSDASTVSLSDPLPANTTFVSATAPAGWTLTTPAVGAAGTVTATRAALASGSGPQAFMVTALVGAGTASGTSLVNTATVSASTADPSPANNSATATATVTVPVPTMGEWALLLTALLLMAAGGWSLRRRQLRPVR